jgi:carboxymethylenebutenolidase
MMKDLNPDQVYLVQEFYEDFREGSMSRRTFIRRLAFITGSMAATIATMSALGCTVSELPSASEPMPTPEPPTAADEEAPAEEAPAEEAAAEEAPAEESADTTAAELVPVPDAQSPFSVPEGDPAVSAGDVTFTSQGDEIMAYLARPVDEGVYPAILVCHENRGLNPHIGDVARRFAKEGYVALAIDLLSREGGTATHDQDEVPGLLGQPGPERHTADFIAGAEYLKTLDFVDGERLGMTGYCFGGGVTWQVAASLPELKAAAPFYGRGPDLEQVPNIQAAVLGVYAEQDERINADLPTLEPALEEAGVTFQINIYPGVGHAFHNDTGERYLEEQATQAWQDTLAWFAEHI